MFFRFSVQSKRPLPKYGKQCSWSPVIQPVVLPLSLNWSGQAQLAGPRMNTTHGTYSCHSRICAAYGIWPGTHIAHSMDTRVAGTGAGSSLGVWWGIAEGISAPWTHWSNLSLIGPYGVPWPWYTCDRLQWRLQVWSIVLCTNVVWSGSRSH